MRILALLILIIFPLPACNTAKSPVSSAASNGSLSPSAVPKEFRHLLPMAQRWGIGDDNERLEATGKATSSDKEALRTSAHPYRQQINSWLDTFGRNPMPPEAAAFMYMLVAMEEMGI